MSNALAIAGVTAVLKNLLGGGLVKHRLADLLGSGVTVSSLPPDVVPLGGIDAVPRLNLFLYQATPNLAWRNTLVPTQDATGRRTTSPPLALDLHYLLTAYGVEELQAEALLGCGLSVLHDTPVLTHEAIRTALQTAPAHGAIPPNLLLALRTAGLAEQIERLKLTPEALSREEMSRVWSALHCPYRPTSAFVVGVVLIERARQAEGPNAGPGGVQEARR